MSPDSDAPDGNRVAANGLEIYYTDSGQGTPLVLLHGGTGTSSSWSDQLPTLSQRFRVLALDSRGHGRTDNPSEELRYGQMAADVAAFIDALGLERPLVMGYSDGGQIALELALHHPGATRAVVIGGAWFRCGDKYFAAVREWGFVGPGQVDLDTIDPGWIEYAKAEHVRDDDPDYWLTVLQQNAGLWYSVQDYSVADLQSISVPALILVGARDQITDLEQSMEMYRHIPAAELLVIPGADHAAAMDHLADDLVLGFLERHS
jgi:pimeloyl-ACP methyl ester carboxylesterase